MSNDTELTVKPVQHRLWPVSYINDDGQQVDSLYCFDPSGVNKEYWVGESFIVETLHTIKMDDTAKQEKLAKLKAQIAKLEGEL